MTLAGLAVSLVSLTYYAAPWAATNAYPLIYAGAGVTCAALGSALAGRRSALPATRVRLGAGVALLLAVALALPPNADLWGDNGFLLGWWGDFAARYLF